MTLATVLPGARRDAGFTLLELIVAASILALIAVFSWRGLDALLREREAIASSQESIDAMQRAFARIERDAMLARDAELDGSGALRLVSGDAAVEYRLVAGALTRNTGGGSAPSILQTGIAKLVIDAWTAGAKGNWVRAKDAATEPIGPAPRQPPPAGAVAHAAASGAQVAADANPPAAVDRASVPAAAAAKVDTAAPPRPPVPRATGIRLAIARTDGTEVVRVFLIGSGG